MRHLERSENTNDYGMMPMLIVFILSGLFIFLVTCTALAVANVQQENSYE